MDPVYAATMAAVGAIFTTPHPGATDAQRGRLPAADVAWQPIVSAARANANQDVVDARLALCMVQSGKTFKGKKQSTTHLATPLRSDASIKR